jgi:hypothetical protein
MSENYSYIIKDNKNNHQQLACAVRDIEIYRKKQIYTKSDRRERERLLTI